MLAETKSLFALRLPPIEGVARTSRIVGLFSVLTSGHKLRLNVSAAIGVEGNPVARFNLRIEVDIVVTNCDSLDSVALQLVIVVPTSEPLAQSKPRDRHSRGINLISRHTFLGVEDTTLLVVEENVVNLFEMRV